MDRQEALRALAAAGKTQEATQTIDESVARAASTYRSIREDRDLSDEAKRRHLAAAYASADAALTAGLTRMAAAAVSGDRDDAARVFGTKGLPGDPASLAISRRDAADRVASATKPDDLRELLKRATRSGDEVLARAVVEKAVENHDATTVNQFIERRPELEAAVERLWAAELAKAETFHFTMRLIGLRPEELQGMNASSAAAFARS